MSRGIVAVLVLCLFVVVGVVNSASAEVISDNFDDDDMNTGLWQFADGGDETNTTLVEQGQCLEWMAADPGTWSDENEYMEGYASNWAFDPNSNAFARIDFSLDNTVMNGGLDLGVYYFTGIPGEGEPDYWASIGVENDSDDGKLFFWEETKTEGDYIEDSWTRNSNSGTLCIDYIPNENGGKLTLYSDESGVDSAKIKVLDVPDTVGYLGIKIDGWAGDGAAISSRGAYFDNFQAEGTMTPEPVSSVLFLIGGASLAAARLRRKKK